MGRPAIGMASAGSFVKSKVSKWTSLVLSVEIRKLIDLRLGIVREGDRQGFIARKLARASGANAQIVIGRQTELGANQHLNAAVERGVGPRRRSDLGLAAHGQAENQQSGQKTKTHQLDFLLGKNNPAGRFARPPCASICLALVDGRREQQKASRIGLIAIGSSNLAAKSWWLAPDRSPLTTDNCS